jgi:hypothetical protein
MVLYLPVVMGSPQKVWQATTLDKTGGVQHQATLAGLTPGRSYEYFVAARGLDSGTSQCVTWVSVQHTFTLND